MVAPTSQNALASMQSDLSAGYAVRDVADRAGVSARAVRRLIRLGKLSEERDITAPTCKAGCAPIGIFPSWLPRDLRGEYRDNAKLYGEEHAARLARAAKAEALRVEA